MPRVDRKAVLGSGRVGERCEQIRRCFDHVAAFLTHEMAVCLARKVVRRRAVTEVRVNYDPQLFELVEVPVDRRKVNVGRQGLDLFCELLGGAVFRVLEEPSEEQTPRRRDPSALCPQKIEHAFHPIGTGRFRSGTTGHVSKDTYWGVDAHETLLQAPRIWTSLSRSGKDNLLVVPSVNGPCEELAIRVDPNGSRREQSC
jgi:hypothetical protein